MAFAGIAALITLAVAAALLLRACRAPGWSIIGGVCAGLLLGSTFLGRLAPDLYNKMYQGGAVQRHQLLALEHYQQLALTDPDRKSIAPDAIADAQRELASAQHTFQTPLRIIALCTTALVLLGAAAGSRGESDPRQHWFHGLSIGIWAAALPGGIAFIILHIYQDVAIAPALIASSAVAIGPWMLSQSDRHSADLAEHGGARLMQQAGAVSSTLAILTIAGAFYFSRGASDLIFIIPLAAIIVGWFGLNIAATWLPTLLQFILIPSLAAFATVKIDLYDDFSFWPMLVIIVLSGDGRWFGAYFGALLPGGRESLRTMRLVMGSMACGPTQLSIAVIAAYSAILDAQYIMPIILGAALVEAVAPLRRRMAERLLQTEIEIDEIMKDS